MSNPNANIVALAKAVNEKGPLFKAARKALAAGRHDVDFTVRVRGTMNVGYDYDTAPTVSIPLLETLALMMHYCGVTRQAAKGILTKVLGEAIADDGKGKGALAETLPWVTEMVETVKEEIVATLPRQPRSGAVTTKLEFAEVADGVLV